MTPLQRAWRTVGGLSDVSKMPGLSWGISARHCITGSKLAKIEGTVCSECYALKNFYIMDNVRKAHAHRLRQYNYYMSEKWNGIPDNPWLMSMKFLINHYYYTDPTRYGWFRWFDSGDLQSVEMLICILRVARDTPNVKHWVSTREYGIVREVTTGPNRWYIPENLTIRLAVHKIGDLPRTHAITKHNQIRESLWPEGVSHCRVYENKPRHLLAGWMCPAHTQGNQCGDCRACWDRDELLVSYPLH